MPRRREIPKRIVMSDPVYNSELVTRFINQIMERGKKSSAERTFYEALDVIKQRSGEDPMKIFKKALDNVKPMLETKSRRVGGSTYQVPVEVNPHRRTSLGIRWIVNYARERGEKTMRDRLANELIDASHNRGSAVKKKEDVHRMAEANKAFAHFRW
ncbi:MAG: 30S ribosomal protein S7 [Acidobacteria bacterium]|nr:30S ribosomal protein S7 [Acidobacteriota bacterium]